MSTNTAISIEISSYKMFILETSSIKECKKIFDFLYNEANFYMNRKYIKYNHYVNTEVSQLIAEDRNA